MTVHPWFQFHFMHEIFVTTPSKSYFVTIEDINGIIL